MGPYFHIFPGGASVKAVWFSVLMMVATAAVGCASGTAGTSNPASGQGKPSARPSSAVAQAAPAPGSKSQNEISSQPSGVFKADPEQWARYQEAAKKEGKVVVAGPPFPNLRQAIVGAMQRIYGITVDYIGLPSGEAQVRVDRESQAGKPTIDVYLSGPGYTFTPEEQQRIFDDAAKLVVDPSILNPAVWRDGAPRILKPIPGASKDFRPGLQGADWIMTDLFVNRDLLPPSSIRTWKDLLKPEYKGKIVSHDPRVGGSGGATLAYLWYLFG